jgi:hypothetical protein
LRNGYAADKYPSEYIEKAELRVKFVENLLKAEGYSVVVFNISDPFNIDLVATNNEEVIGVEITNWKEGCYLTLKKFLGYKRHWKKMEEEMINEEDSRLFKKWLIYSFDKNIKFMKGFLKAEGVELFEIGYQHLPKQEAKPLISLMSIKKE